MRQAKSVFSILKLDVVMNPPVFNNCAVLHRFGLFGVQGSCTLLFTRGYCQIPKKS